MCVNSDRILYKTKSWGEYPGCGLHEEVESLLRQLLEPCFLPIGLSLAYHHRSVLLVLAVWSVHAATTGWLVSEPRSSLLLFFHDNPPAVESALRGARRCVGTLGALPCVTNNQFFVQGLMPTTEHSKRPTPTHSKRPTPTHGECLRHTVRRDMTQ